MRNSVSRSSKHLPERGTVSDLSYRRLECRIYSLEPKRGVKQILQTCLKVRDIFVFCVKKLHKTMKGFNTGVIS